MLIIKRLIVILLISSSSLGAEELKKEKLPPSAVGWGNLIVPGLGATLRDHPVRGLTEASLEIGSFYGGTLLAEEGRFKIDGSALIPSNGHIGRAMTAQMMQQFGLKFHFYNTFYHYQQAVLEDEQNERERSNPQPIYRGDWKDMLLAPFRWENVSSIWTWPIIAAVGGYLLYDYTRAPIKRRASSFSRSDDLLFGASELISVPIGSSFGEDPLFRGFIEREVRGMTGSLILAVAAESTLFALLHEDHLTSFGVGIYFGIEADQLKGELGPMMAAHFWINVIIGLLDYWSFRRSEGKDAPFNPPVNAQIMIPF